MATDSNRTAAESRRLSIPLPGPLWIGLTTVGLVCVAFAVQVVLPICRRQMAIRDIDRAGGYFQTLACGPDWLRSQIGDDRMRFYYEPITYVVVSESECDDTWMKCLEFLPDLQVLILDGSNVTDAGMQHLRGLTNLKELSLPHTRVTNAGLVHLKGLSSLESIWIQNTRVTAAAMIHLEAAWKLKFLLIDHDSMSDAEILDLKHRFPNLDVNLSGSNRSTDW